jgi:hypothetical protein
VYRLGIGILLFLFYVDPRLAVIKSSLLATVDSSTPTGSELARTRPFEPLLLSGS